MPLVAALGSALPAAIHSVVDRRDMEISPVTERLPVGAAAIFMSGGGPRNGQEAARAEVHPRSRRVGRAAGAPALVSLLRQAVLRRGAADSPDVNDHPDASSPASAPPASAPPAAAAPPAQTQTT